MPYDAIPNTEAHYQYNKTTFSIETNMEYESLLKFAWLNRIRPENSWVKSVLEGPISHFVSHRYKAFFPLEIDPQYVFLGNGILLF